MVKELIKVVITVFLTTIITYPVTSIFADVMTAIWPTSLLNTIVVTLIRYLGFFIGIGLLMYLYRGRQTRQYSYSEQNPYTGVN